MLRKKRLSQKRARKVCQEFESVSFMRSSVLRKMTVLRSSEMKEKFDTSQYEKMLKPLSTTPATNLSQY